MMIESILHLSDTHSQHREMKTLPDADLLIHSGDFTINGTPQETADFLEWFCRLPHKYKIFIAGNHDDSLQNEISGLPENCFYLNNSGITVDGINIYGVPLLSSKKRDGRYAEHLSGIPNDTDILISHQPPFGILDFRINIHYGDPFLLKRVSSIQPRFHLFGHVHNQYGKENRNGTLFVNSSAADKNNRLLQRCHWLKIRP